MDFGREEEDCEEREIGLSMQCWIEMKFLGLISTLTDMHKMGNFELGTCQSFHCPYRICGFAWRDCRMSLLSSQIEADNRHRSIRIT